MGRRTTLADAKNPEEVRLLSVTPTSGGGKCRKDPSEDGPASQNQEGSCYCDTPRTFCKVDIEALDSKLTVASI